MSEALRQVARQIFAEALRAVDVREAVRKQISIHNGLLTLAGRSVPLSDLDELLVVAIGKAAVPMFQAAAQQLGAIRLRAVVVAPDSTLPPGSTTHEDVVFLQGDHPALTQNSLLAAGAILRLLRSATDRTAVLFLVSGGASAMIEQPLDPAISFDDLVAFSRAVVGCGMGITEMNTLRKHLSAVKGGRMAVAASAARMQCTLLVSDVPDASPDAIASGPSLPDSTTVDDTRRLFRRLQESWPIPASVEAWFNDPAMPETPKPDDPAFAHAYFQVILSSTHLAEAAAQAAIAAGLRAVIDNTPDDWEYREAADYLLTRAAGLQANTCLISVGELNVRLPAEHGEGGRNQQFALWSALEIERRGLAMTVLSAGSDGVDGYSNAAGALCDETTVQRASALGHDASDALRGFASAPLLAAAGDAIVTGATGQNLRDLRLILK